MINQRTLTIGMYTPTTYGGHVRYAEELLTALAAVGSGRGVAPELITCEDYGEEICPPYPVHRLFPRLVPREEFRSTAHWAVSRIGYYARRGRQFLDWIGASPRFDIIHFQEYTHWLAPGDFRALRRRGIALVFTVHNITHHYSKFFMHAAIRDRCFRSAWRACDALLVHTDGLRDALSRFLAGSHPPIHVTPHGVWRGGDQGKFEAAGAGAGAECPRLLFFGVLRPNKGVDVLLRALQRLPRCELTIAGGAEEPRYVDRIRRMVGQFPAGRVTLIDRYIGEDEVADLIARSRLVVLPYTHFSAQSGVLHQALAYGRPVVATDVGAMGECVRRWGIGQVVPPGDAARLAGAIEQALDGRTDAAARAAITRVRDELTWTRAAEATIDVYRSILR
jgi:glycosyltransferase involved in cell wall biosynthesis